METKFSASERTQQNGSESRPSDRADDVVGNSSLEKNWNLSVEARMDEWLSRKAKRDRQLGLPIDWDDPTNGHPKEHLEKQIQRVRSDRPLVADLKHKITIEDLYYWNLLHLGREATWDLADGVTITTKLAGDRGTFELRIGEKVFTFGLVSRPFGKMLAWYFVCPATSERFKTLYISDGLIGSRKAFDATYHSKHQGKIFRKLMRMDRILLQIEGDPVQHVGPARGKSKLRKFAELRLLLEDVELADLERVKVLGEYPQFQRTIKVAKALLKREIPKFPKGWAQMDGVKKVPKPKIRKVFQGTNNPQVP